jgi:hypothetical protein
MTSTTIPCPAISTNFVESFRDDFEALSKLGEQEYQDGLTEFLLTLSPAEYDQFRTDFPFVAHLHQTPPAAANNGKDWATWLILGGRGAGKTRAGAEWVRSIALADPKARIALVGETEHEVRSVMIEGVAGLLAVHQRCERPQWFASRRRLEWKNGAVAEMYSAENYEGLRGPQFSAAWCDELAKWRHGLHTCPQQAWVSFHRTVRAFLDLPDPLMIYSGMALGYEDPAAPINGWRSPRAALDDFASFDGFES